MLTQKNKKRIAATRREELLKALHLEAVIRILISLLMGHQIDGQAGIPCQNLIHFHLEDTVMT